MRPGMTLITATGKLADGYHLILSSPPWRWFLWG